MGVLERKRYIRGGEYIQKEERRGARVKDIHEGGDIGLELIGCLVRLGKFQIVG